jgi:hypothetical protein
MPALVVAELSATAVIALASVVVVYLLIIAIVALAAVFHADPLRRADAHRVLTALLTVCREGREGREAEPPVGRDHAFAGAGNLIFDHDLGHALHKLVGVVGWWDLSYLWAHRPELPLP